MGHDDPAQAITPAPRRAIDPTRPTRVRYQVLAAACSLAVLTYVLRQGFIAGTPFIKEAFRLDDEEMGYLAAYGWWLTASSRCRAVCSATASAGDTC